MTISWLSPQILGPSRITGPEKPSLIDNIFINFHDLQCSSGNLIERISEHLPNFLITEQINITKMPKTKIRKIDYINFDSEILIKEFQNLNIENKTHMCLNNKYVYIHEKTMKIINKNIPLKELSGNEIKKKKKPWVTKAILKSIKQKNHFLKLFLKTKQQFHYQRYKVYRDKINHLLRKSKKDYYSKYFEKNAKNAKKNWKQINTIVNKTKTSDIITCIDTNDMQYETDPLKIGNKLNEYFNPIAQKLVDQIKSEEFLDKPNEKSFFMIRTDKDETEKIIAALDRNRASDIYVCL